LDELRIDTDDDRVQARGSLKVWAEQATERSEKGGPKSDEGRGWKVCDGREKGEYERKSMERSERKRQSRWYSDDEW